MEEWARGNGLELRRPLPVAFDGPQHYGLRLHERGGCESVAAVTSTDALLHSSVVLPVWLILILRLFLFMYYVCPK